MRVTQSRYAGELNRFELAMRMLRLQARTGTIARYTELSNDRIRKAYANYVLEHGHNKLPRRKRGRPPSRIGRFLSTPQRLSESTVLATLFMHAGLLVRDERSRCHVPRNLTRLMIGRRLCDAYDMYRTLIPQGHINLEVAAMLLRAISETQDLIMTFCGGCQAVYVQDAYALDYGRGPCCDWAPRGAQY